MDNLYRNVFLSDRYVNYRFLNAGLTQNDLELQKIAKIQRSVQESCLLRATMIGIGSGVIGTLIGSFLFSINVSNTTVPVEDKPLTVKGELAKQYKQFVPYIKSTVKSFVKLGFMYSMFECLIQKQRANSDVSNAVYAGCATGAFLGVKNGPFAAAGGCAGFAAFSYLMEKYQRSK